MPRASSPPLKLICINNIVNKKKQIFQQLSLKKLKCSKETERLCVCRDRDRECVERYSACKDSEGSVCVKR